MVWCETPATVFEVQYKKHSEELLSICKGALFSCFLLDSMLLCTGPELLSVQKPERVDDWLINEMLRAVSFVLNLSMDVCLFSCFPV